MDEEAEKTSLNQPDEHTPEATPERESEPKLPAKRSSSGISLSSMTQKKLDEPTAEASVSLIVSDEQVTG